VTPEVPMTKSPSSNANKATVIDGSGSHGLNSGADKKAADREDMKQDREADTSTTGPRPCDASVKNALEKTEFCVSDIKKLVDFTLRERSAEEGKKTVVARARAAKKVGTKKAVKESGSDSDEVTMTKDPNSHANGVTARRDLSRRGCEPEEGTKAAMAPADTAKKGGTVGPRRDEEETTMTTDMSSRHANKVARRGSRLEAGKKVAPSELCMLVSELRKRLLRILQAEARVEVSAENKELRMLLENKTQLLGILDEALLDLRAEDALAADDMDTPNMVLVVMSRIHLVKSLHTLMQSAALASFSLELDMGLGKMDSRLTPVLKAISVNSDDKSSPGIGPIDSRDSSEAGPSQIASRDLCALTGDAASVAISIERKLGLLGRTATTARRVLREMSEMEVARAPRKNLQDVRKKREVQQPEKPKKPMAPEPVEPEPVEPEPVEPEPVEPEPVEPEPVEPEPVEPEPVAPEPTEPMELEPVVALDLLGPVAARELPPELGEAPEPEVGPEPVTVEPVAPKPVAPEPVAPKPQRVKAQPKKKKVKKDAEKQGLMVVQPNFG